MKKRSLLLCLALVLSLTMAIGGTLAYLTDTETTTNVMVVGNVDIEISEVFEADKPLYPAVKLADGTMQGTIQKKVSVKNVGSSDAYVRTIIAFPELNGTPVTLEADSPIVVNFAEGFNKNTITTQNDVEINGREYTLFTCVYSNAIKAGTTTTPSLMSFYMNPNVTNKDLENFNGEYRVLVTAQAVQSANFAEAGYTAAKALETAFDTASEDGDNSPSWGEDLKEYDVTPETLNATTQVKDGTYHMGKGEYTLPTMKDKDVTFSGTKDTVIDMTTAITAHDSTVTFEGITIDFKSNENYRGVQHAKKVVYKDCTINGMMTNYAPEAEFINCEFNVVGMGDVYNIWTYGGKDVTFTDCTFNSSGKAVLVYTEGETHADIKFKDCTFNDDNALKEDDGVTDLKKAAVEVGSSPNSTATTYNLYFDNCTVNGFAVNNKGINTGSKLWGNKNSMGSGYLKVTVTGTTYTTIGTAEELFAFAEDVNKNGYTYAGWTVKLTADIDLKNKAWTPIGQTGATQFLGTFDGNNKTIKNLNIDSSAQTGGTYSSGLFGWIERHGEDADYLMAVKNLNIDGATVKGNHNVAVIAGYLIGTIENCNVTNAKVVCTHANDEACGDKAGVIAGIAAEAKALIKGCTASNSTVQAGRDAGQIVGACIVGKVENCTATNVTVSATGDCNGNNVSNAIIGRTN